MHKHRRDAEYCCLCNSHYVSLKNWRNFEIKNFFRDAGTGLDTKTAGFSAVGTKKDAETKVGTKGGQTKVEATQKLS